MYRINLDFTKKVVHIELSGNISMEELASYIDDFCDLINTFENNVYSVLVFAQRLDPISQDKIPYFQRLVEGNLLWAKKIAVIYGNRTMTKYQMQKIESSARKAIESETPIMAFKTRDDAINYIYAI